MNKNQDAGFGIQDSVISCRNLSKTFMLGKLQVPVLKNISLNIARRTGVR